MCINKPFLGVVFALVFFGLGFRFLDNPLMFDDANFFVPEGPRKFLEGINLLEPRAWVYATFSLSFQFFGPEIWILRVQNLVLHIAVAGALFLFIRQLLSACVEKQSSVFWVAACCSVLFLFHPLGSYGYAYLIQRTIVIATLFALLSWWLFLLGAKQQSPSFFLLSVLSALLSMFAKEHAVMLPVINGLLFLGLTRLQTLSPRLRRMMLWTLFFQCLLSFAVFFARKHLIGEAYEPVLADHYKNIEHVHLLSVLNQAGLFFKYAFLWVLPDPRWLSLDMLRPFPLELNDVFLLLGGAAYCLIGLTGFLLLCFHRQGLVLGLSLLIPWVMFLTEFASVRVQEPFVLYRSYLWSIGAFLFVAYLLLQIGKKRAIFAVAVFSVFFAGLLFDRLLTLSSPALVWDEAVHLMQRHESKVVGEYRPYFNRGNAYYTLGFYPLALLDYEKVIEVEPEFGRAYFQKAMIMDQSEDKEGALTYIDLAIRKGYADSMVFFSRAKLLRSMGDVEGERQSLRIACVLGRVSACNEGSPPPF